MNADGTGQTNLSNHPAEDFTPAFSPNGLKMAFTSTRDGDREVYKRDVDRYRDDAHRQKLSRLHTSLDGTPALFL